MKIIATCQTKATIDWWFRLGFDVHTIRLIMCNMFLEEYSGRYFYWQYNLFWPMKELWWNTSIWTAKVICNNYS